MARSRMTHLGHRCDTARYVRGSSLKVLDLKRPIREADMQIVDMVGPQRSRARKSVRREHSHHRGKLALMRHADFCKHMCKFSSRRLLGNTEPLCHLLELESRAE